MTQTEIKQIVKQAAKLRRQGRHEEAKQIVDAAADRVAAAKAGR